MIPYKNLSEVGGSKQIFAHSTVYLTYTIPYLQTYIYYSLIINSTNKLVITY